MAGLVLFLKSSGIGLVGKICRIGAVVGQAPTAPSLHGHTTSDAWRMGLLQRRRTAGADTPPPTMTLGPVGVKALGSSLRVASQPVPSSPSPLLILRARISSNTRHSTLFGCCSFAARSFTPTPPTACKPSTAFNKHPISRPQPPPPPWLPGRLQPPCRHPAWARLSARHAATSSTGTSKKPKMKIMRIRPDYEPPKSILGEPVVTHIYDIPPWYTDAKGLAVRRFGLDAKAIADVFPGDSAMTHARGNKLLRILHGRRVAGTLRDPELGLNTVDWTDAQQDCALAWLRSHGPAVDEVAMEGLRAEDELAAMEEEAERAREEARRKELSEDAAEAEKIAAEAGEVIRAAQSKDTFLIKPGFKLFKEPWLEEVGESEEGADEQRKGLPAPAPVPAADVFGKGAFDKIREKNQKKREEKFKRWQEEKTKKEAELLAKGWKWGDLQTSDGAPAETGLTNDVRPRNYVQQVVHGLRTGLISPERQAVRERIEYWKKRTTSDLAEPPKMAKWERLLPSTFLVLFVTTVLVTAAAYYEEPSESQRLLPFLSPAVATIGLIVCANFAVRFMWYVGPFWRALNYACLVIVGLPRPVSMFGAIFSHHKYTHLLGNMVFLCLIGPRLHDEVGRADFVATFLASGGFGFLATLWYYVLRGSLVVASLGASGAVYGVASAYFWIHKDDRFRVLGMPPDPLEGVPGWLWLALLVAINLRGAHKSWGLSAELQRIDFPSHFGGIAAGIMAGQVLRTKLAQKKQQGDLEKGKGGGGGGSQKTISMASMNLDRIMWWRQMGGEEQGKRR